MAKQTYTGACHCNAVRIEAEMEIKSLISCNCSICSKKALVLTFIPESDFKLLSGETHLVEYLFNKHQIHHNFCNICGVQVFSSGKMPDGGAMRAINVRCLDDIDITQFPIKNFDGKSV